MKFRKIPVVIDAVRLTEENSAEMVHWIMNDGDRHAQVFGDGEIWIETLEGIMKARPGDWIIKGVENEFYPCKNSVFEKTYERIS